MGKGRVEENCNLSAHKVDFDKALAVFTCSRADAMKVAWETEAFDTRTAEAAIRQRSTLVGAVHCKGDRGERETERLFGCTGHSPGL